MTSKGLSTLEVMAFARPLVSHPRLRSRTENDDDDDDDEDIIH